MNDSLDPYQTWTNQRPTDSPKPAATSQAASSDHSDVALRNYRLIGRVLVGVALVICTTLLSLWYISSRHAAAERVANANAEAARHAEATAKAELATAEALRAQAALKAEDEQREAAARDAAERQRLQELQKMQLELQVARTREVADAEHKEAVRIASVDQAALAKGRLLIAIVDQEGIPLWGFMNDLRQTLANRSTYLESTAFTPEFYRTSLAERMFSGDSGHTLKALQIDNLVDAVLLGRASFSSRGADEFGFWTIDVDCELTVVDSSGRSRSRFHCESSGAGRSPQQAREAALSRARATLDLPTLVSALTP